MILAITYLIGVSFFGALCVISLLNQHFVVLGFSMFILFVLLASIKLETKVSTKIKQKQKGGDNSTQIQIGGEDE